MYQISLFINNEELFDKNFLQTDLGYLYRAIPWKEVKGVEFGAKVNKIQVYGINFIQHLSYDAFNEGLQVGSVVRLHRQLFGKCSHISADKIYATNANRKYCKKEKITTNFKKLVS